MRKNLTQHYCWKFLRLNSDYKHDYDLFQNELSNTPEKDKNSYAAEINHELYQKYGINSLADYSSKQRGQVFP